MKRAALVVLAAAAMAACTSSASTPPDTSRTNTQTVTHTNSPSGNTFKPPRAKAVRPLPPGANHRGERDGKCPYIRSGLDEDSGGGVNVADIEGDRVYRTTILTRLRPVGCRFYFYSSPFEAIADIQPRRFATATAAFNAMVLTAQAGTDQITERNFVKGVTGICYRTRFFAQDGPRDWAFVFAKGKTMVIVHTQRKDTSRSALYIARAIARKF